MYNVYFKLICDNKDIVFAWVPGHVGIRGNSVVDLAPKRALEKPVSKRLAVPYCDFKVLTNMYTKKLWQTEWGRPEDILRINCLRFNPKWMILFRLMVDVAVRKLFYGTAYWSHFLNSFLPIEKWGTASMHTLWSVMFYWIPAHRVCRPDGMEKAVFFLIQNLWVCC